jgi:hypothetical protein
VLAMYCLSLIPTHRTNRCGDFFAVIEVSCIRSASLWRVLLLMIMARYAISRSSIALFQRAQTKTGEQDVSGVGNVATSNNLILCTFSYIVILVIVACCILIHERGLLICLDGILIQSPSTMSSVIV